MDRYEQYPENPKFADPEYGKKWLRGEFVDMNQKEQEELLLHYGSRKERKAIKERRKAREQAQKKQGKYAPPSASVKSASVMKPKPPPGVMAAGASVKVIAAGDGRESHVGIVHALLDDDGDGLTV